MHYGTSLQYVKIYEDQQIHTKTKSGPVAALIEWYIINMYTKLQERHPR